MGYFSVIAPGNQTLAQSIYHDTHLWINWPYHQKEELQLGGLTMIFSTII